MIFCVNWFVGLKEHAVKKDSHWSFTRFVRHNNNNNNNNEDLI